MIRAIAVLCPIVLAAGLSACVLPPPGSPAGGSDPQTGVDSPAQAMTSAAASRELVGRLLARTPLLEDAAAQAYVNRLGRWLTLNTEQADSDWRFGILDSDELMVLAAPPGTVLVSRELLLLLETEDEVAAVLAQGIGHLLAGHPQAALDSAASGPLPIVPATTIGGIGASPVERLRAVWERGFTPAQVFAADALAARLLVRAGYDAYALPAYWSMLEELDADDPRVAALLAVLPSAEQRIEKLQALLQGELAGYGSTLSNQLRWPNIRQGLLQAAR